MPEGVRNIRVPTAAERNGDFSQTTDGVGAMAPNLYQDPLLTGNCNPTDQSACFRDPSRATAGNPLGLNIIPVNRFYSSGQAILNLYPLPNVTGNPQFNFTSSVSTLYPRREDILRIDYNITDRTRLSARYTNNAENGFLPMAVSRAI